MYIPCPNLRFSLELITCVYATISCNFKNENEVKLFINHEIWFLVVDDDGDGRSTKRTPRNLPTFRAKI